MQYILLSVVMSVKTSLGPSPNTNPDPGSPLNQERERRGLGREAKVKQRCISRPHPQALNRPGTSVVHYSLSIIIK